jgi:hypothetical protein
MSPHGAHAFDRDAPILATDVHDREPVRDPPLAGEVHLTRHDHGHAQLAHEAAARRPSLEIEGDRRAT